MSETSRRIADKRPKKKGNKMTKQKTTEQKNTEQKITNTPTLPDDREIDIGLGLTAQVSWAYVPPSSPPFRGADWPESQDYPNLSMILHLPGEDLLAPALRVGVSVLGETLHDTWGWQVSGSTGRQRHKLYSGPSWKATIATAEAELTLTVATLRSITAAREARLQEREATIARVLAS